MHSVGDMHQPRSDCPDTQTARDAHVDLVNADLQCHNVVSIRKDSDINEQYGQQLRTCRLTDRTEPICEVGDIKKHFIDGYESSSFTFGFSHVVRHIYAPGKRSIHNIFSYFYSFTKTYVVDNHYKNLIANEHQNLCFCGEIIEI